MELLDSGAQWFSRVSNTGINTSEVSRSTREQLTGGEASVMQYHHIVDTKIHFEQLNWFMKMMEEIHR